MNKKAFTLVEVLITLTIIGVVASLTVPMLVNATKELEYKSAAKNTYAEVNRALKRMQADGSYWSKISTDRYVNSRQMRSKFAEYLQFMEVKDNSSLLASGTYKNYKTAGGVDYSVKDWPTAKSPIGSVYKFVDPTTVVQGERCTLSWVLNSVTFDKYCGQIQVDTNGTKSPNTWGMDFISIIIRQSQDGSYYAQPLGAMGSNSNCKIGCTVNPWGACGYECTYNLITDTPLP